jgi:cytochrome oxidase Cu insertion factor (SCO1/SenC/PrrC family)
MIGSRIRLGLFIAAGLLAGALAALALLPGAREALLSGTSMPSAGRALVGGPFTLTDHTGKRVTEADFRGKFMLVFFGFTFCPDVCPSGLQVISAALDKLGPRAERVVPIFVTIDPERDTPEQMAMYVKSFHPRLIGLTGTPAEIEAITKAYRVYAKKVPDPKSSAGYTMDHSSIIYVIGPDGAYRTHFTHATSVDALTEGLSKMLR